MICGESGKKVPINSLSPEVQAISSNRIDQVSLYIYIYSMGRLFMICGESGKKVPINSFRGAISSNRIDNIIYKYIILYIEYIIYIYRINQVIILSISYIFFIIVFSYDIFIDNIIYHIFFS